MENILLFAIRDIDTQQNLQSFFGRTKITRLQKGANPKAKPDAQEVEIELIDDNVIKMLETGHHITYMPKEKRTLYVGYTKYPNVPKTQEGYIRQGRGVEDDFILFKQGLLIPKKQQHKEKRVVPPDVLYLAVDNDMLDTALREGLVSPVNGYIPLSYDINSAFQVEENNKNTLSVLEIKTYSMYENNDKLWINKENNWVVNNIDAKFIKEAIV